MDITTKELKKRQQEGDDDYILIDVREGYEREEFSIGGRHIPLGEIAAHIEDLSEHKDDEVIVYCRSGRRSAMAQELLRQAGFKKVRNLEGGMLAWQE